MVDLKNLLDDASRDDGRAVDAHAVLHAGRRRVRRRSLLRAGAALALVLVVSATALAVRPWESEETRMLEPVSPPAPSRVSDAIPFEQFPLDRGWKEAFGQDIVIDGPSPDGAGVQMPEGHCRQGVLFYSGSEKLLSTGFGELGEISRHRELRSYASADAAQATLRKLRDAVASCAAFNDAYTDKVTYTAEVFKSIDKANARAGTATFTFAYTASGESDPFGVLYQFAVFDDVLFGSNQYGEWTAESAGDAVTAMDRENAPLIPLLSRLQ